MVAVTMHKAKTHLSQLVAQVEAGEDVVIMRGHLPVARLVAIVPEQPPRRRFGALKGQVAVSDAFFEPLPEQELETWE
jgi:prevent-host-death family protein